MAKRLLEYVRANPGESTGKVTTAVTGRNGVLREILRRDDRFVSEGRGQATLWFAADTRNPVRGNGTGWDGVPATEDDANLVPSRHRPPTGV
jgi:hypothetical protein